MKSVYWRMLADMFQGRKIIFFSVNILPWHLLPSLTCMQREFHWLVLQIKTTNIYAVFQKKSDTLKWRVEYFVPKSNQITLFINLIIDWYHWWWEGRNVQKSSDWKNKPPWPGRNYLTQCWCGDVYCFYDFILCMPIKESKLSKYITKIIYGFNNISLYITCFHFIKKRL